VPSTHGRTTEQRTGKRLLPPVALVASIAVALSLAIVVLAPRSAEATVFDANTVPKVASDPDPNPAELGVRFSVSKTIMVSGIRFYRGAGNSGRHVGHLWSATGRALRTVRFAPTSAIGWTEAKLSKPLRVSPGQQLVASYSAPHGHYANDPGGFAQRSTDGVVTFPRGAGVFSYRMGSMPRTVWRNANYYVDISYSVGHSPTPSASGSATPPPAATPSPSLSTAAPGGAVSLDLPREAWWGGPSYYAEFSKAAQSGWTSPSFFPIAVFFGKPEHAAALKAAGINTYMGAEHDGSAISTITRTGMSVIAQDEWTRAEIGNDPRVVGWHVSDECDMGEGGCDGSTENARLAQQKQQASALRLGDGRFLQSNIGNGVLGTFWAPTTMPQFVSTVDVTSVDKYAYTSPPVDDVIRQSSYWPTGANPASSRAYGWLQDRMATFSHSATPNWVFVETAKPYLTESGARTIRPDQIEGAVWNAIIHGAAGIAYFQHNNNGTCGTYSILQCGSALTAKITAIDAQVQSLAPVINTPSYRWDFGPGLDTSLKVSGGDAYIFAMADGTAGKRTFTLPKGLTGTIRVVGENRTITPSNGSFTDSFAAEYTHHIYRIASN
jgi:hypothetical protein